MRLFLRHATRLASDLCVYCWEHDVIWPLIVTLLLFAAGLIAGGVAIVTPYIYTVF